MPGRFTPTTIHCPVDAERAIEAFDLTVPQLVARHANGDWGSFNNKDAASAIQSPVRDRAALLAMVDCGLRAAEVCRISCSDIDWNTSTIIIREHRQPRPPELEALLRNVRKSESSAGNPQRGPTQRSCELSADVKSAVEEWLAQCPSGSGPIFPNLETTYLTSLMKLSQSHAVANEIALLLRRGTVQSLFVLDQGLLRRPFSPSLVALNVLIQTCLDSSQTEVLAPVKGPALLALHVKLDPTLMFGPNRQPFRCTNTVILAPENWDIGSSR